MVDNGPAETGPDGNQANTDGDLQGDACDTDDDNDGLTDDEETSGSRNPFSPKPTQPKDADSDNDGLNDGEELTAGTDGFITDPNDVDTDNDGTDDSDDADPRNPLIE